MNLIETITLMISGSYKDTFLAEYKQTKIRYEKLKKLNNKIEAYYSLDESKRGIMQKPVYDCPNNLLRQQQHIMGEYLHILEVRAEIEGIEL